MKKIINMWEHTTWGNNIEFFDWESRKIVGWLGSKPNKGDEIRSKMQSGKIARFEVKEVENCSNPDDMFFATVKDLDYL